MAARRSTIVSLSLLALLTLAMFGDVLFAGGSRVLGDQGSDLFLQYYAWRDFAFRELAKGNLALWNPHIFSGAPYFGGMQGAQLYPPNWIFLALPLPVAINWSVAIHVFGIGAFMFVWMRHRSLGAPASFFAGAVVMFCGAFFPHVFAGHLPQICAMTWAPLIFCAIDAIFENISVRPLLLGTFAVAMQLLAGFPQYVFYTALMAGLYCAIRLVRQWSWRRVLYLLGIYLGGALLAAVQLLPAMQTTAETTRGLRLPFQFASMVGVPPENFLTFLAPDFFGEMAKYWGRWYLWETSLYIGIVALVFAVYATFRCERKITLPAVVIALVSLLLALGLYTPLFGFLYHWVPGFDRFRSISKFIFCASLFLVLLSATGLDHLFRQKKISITLPVSVFAIAATLAVAGWAISKTASWSALMNSERVPGQSFLFPQLYSDTDFIAQSQHRGAMSLFFAAGIAGLLAMNLWFVRRKTKALHGVIALAALEIFMFARANRATSDSAKFVNPEEKNFLAEHPGDYRIINVTNPNSAMILRAQDMWGYDATVVRRYAEFMTWTQGGDPNEAMSYVKFTQFDPLFAMLRQRYVFAARGGKLDSAEAPVAPMPHVQLLSNYRVLKSRDEIFSALRSETFDPTREVLLESEPEPQPISGDSSGTVEITESSTDSLTVKADLEHAAILLITDSYTKSWRAIGLPGSVQSAYQLLPANYILRAVPLAAGHHLLRIEYASRAFAIGKWISILATLGFCAALFTTWRQPAPKNREQPAVKKAKRNSKRHL